MVFGKIALIGSFMPPKPQKVKFLKRGLYFGKGY